MEGDMFSTAEELKAISSSPCPCDNCGARQKCKDQRMACADFARFVITGRASYESRLPSREIYFEVFSE